MSKESKQLKTYVRRGKLVKQNQLHNNEDLEFVRYYTDFRDFHAYIYALDSCERFYSFVCSQETQSQLAGEYRALY